MNKTIYVRDEDAAIWERARELAGEKLSPVIAAALKRFVAEKEAEAKGFERIEIRYDDSDRHHIPSAKAFHGKWIFPPSKPVASKFDEDDICTHYCAIAITAKGAAVFYSWVTNDFDEELIGNFKFAVYTSLEEAACNPRVNAAARKAVEKMGVPVEELDI